MGLAQPRKAVWACPTLRPSLFDFYLPRAPVLTVIALFRPPHSLLLSSYSSLLLSSYFDQSCVLYGSRTRPHSAGWSAPIRRRRYSSSAGPRNPKPAPRNSCTSGRAGLASYSKTTGTFLFWLPIVQVREDHFQSSWTPSSILTPQLARDTFLALRNPEPAHIAGIKVPFGRPQSIAITKPTAVAQSPTDSLHFVYKKEEEMHFTPYFLEMPEYIYSTRVFLKMFPEHKTRKRQFSFEFTLVLPVALI